MNAVQPGEIPVLILTGEIWNPTRFWSVPMTYNDMGHSPENWTKEGAAFVEFLKFKTWNYHYISNVMCLEK